ncbi:kinase of RNA polymerase II carboxy-terminal domain, alpha subunit [Scheffersomyces xylosifermentans]|uniref:kinase of RNA polymerase II carboxy-terminal domain, alpha subunit n=1 Tax=Scheffersomyces xylosifermentans TaxID=1304137 RepID=UPI00315D804F
MSDRYRPPPPPPKKSNRDYQKSSGSGLAAASSSGPYRSSFGGDPYKPSGRRRPDVYRPRNDTYTPGQSGSRPDYRDSEYRGDEDGGASIGSKRSFVGTPSGPRGNRKKNKKAPDGERRRGDFRGGRAGRGDLRGGRGGRGDLRGGPNSNSSKIPHASSGTPNNESLTRNQLYAIQVIRSSRIYQRVQQVGEGTYGRVYKAKNTITGEYVALKKLRLESEREGFPITAMREIKLLQSFDHENIVGLLEMMVEHNQIYMIFDYLDHDLTGLLTHPDLVLEESHRKYIFKQLMEGLNYLHKKRVIHRDIKGSNILLNSTGGLKIADFGLARTMKIVNDGESPDYTNRVITIWYRPPELLLGATDYGREVDIWGVGCLLIELYSKVAAFQGFDEVGQLCKIYNVMGTPTLEEWPNIQNLPWFEMLKPKVNTASKFEEKYKSIMSPDSYDLALKLLALNPSERLSAEEALEHDYFKNEPQPEPLMFLKDVEGEWHEFETKQRRRQERKRLHDEARANKSTAPRTQEQVGTDQIDRVTTITKSVSEVTADDGADTLPGSTTSIAPPSLTSVPKSVPESEATQDI